MMDTAALGPLEKIEAQLDQIRAVFPGQGSFVFRSDQIIRSVLRDNNVPDKYGAYVIFGTNYQKNDVLYIGRSGKMRSDGTFHKQALRGRLANKQGGISRQVFFRNMISEREVDYLTFEWFITFDQRVHVMPALIESLLFQAYFTEHGKLPPYNKEA